VGMIDYRIYNGTEGFQTVLPTWSHGYLTLGFSSPWRLRSQ